MVNVNENINEGINESTNVTAIIIVGIIIFIALSIIFFMLKWRKRNMMYTKKEDITKNSDNASETSKMQDDDITKEDAETFLEIIKLLDQLYK